MSMKFLTALAYFYVIDEEERNFFIANGVRPELIANKILASGMEMCRNYAEQGVEQDDIAFRMRDFLSRINHFVEVDQVPRSDQPNAFKRMWKEYKLSVDTDRFLEGLKTKKKSVDEVVDWHLKNKAEGVNLYNLADFEKILLEELQKSLSKRLVKIDGFHSLSEMIGGFNESRIGLMMAPTGFGKTNLMLNLAIAAKAEYRILYINMEMSPTDVMRRLAVIMSGMTYKEFLTEPFNFQQKNQEHDYFSKDSENLKITDGRGMDIQTIEALIGSGDYDFVFIDYDQKIDLGDDYKTPEWKLMQQAFIDLEEMAKKYKTHILVSAQINRDGQIASSHRATYPMHYVIKFHEHETIGNILEMHKNRHGVGDAYVRVEYVKNNSSITEKDFEPQSMKDHQAAQRAADQSAAMAPRMSAKVFEPARKGGPDANS